MASVENDSSGSSTEDGEGEDAILTASPSPAWIGGEAVRNSAANNSTPILAHQPQRSLTAVLPDLLPLNSTPLIGEAANGQRRASLAANDDVCNIHYTLKHINIM